MAAVAAAAAAACPVKVRAVFFSASLPFDRSPLPPSTSVHSPLLPPPPPPPRLPAQSSSLIFLLFHWFSFTHSLPLSPFIHSSPHFIPLPFPFRFSISFLCAILPPSLFWFFFELELPSLLSTFSFSTVSFFSLTALFDPCPTFYSLSHPLSLSMGPSKFFFSLFLTLSHSFLPPPASRNPESRGLSIMMKR